MWNSGFCRCFVLFRRAYVGVNKTNPSPHKARKTPHHLWWCQPSSLCPCVPSCPGAGHVCHLPGSSAGQPQLCQGSQDRSRTGYFPCYTIQSYGWLKKMQLGFNLKRNQPLSQGLVALGGTQMELGAAFLHHSCRQFWEHRHQLLLLQGLQSAEHLPSVKLCSPGSALLWWSPCWSAWGSLMMLESTETGQGQGTLASLRLPVNLKRYSKGSSAAWWSLCSNRYLVTKSGYQLETLWSKACFSKWMILQFLKGNSLLLLASAARRQAMNKIS